MRGNAKQAFQKATGTSDGNAAMAEYERLADEMWKAQVWRCAIAANTKKGLMSEWNRWASGSVQDP